MSWRWVALAEGELAAPLGEGAFGDAEFGGDADEAPALGPELDKFLNRFLIFHLTFQTDVVML